MYELIEIFFTLEKNIILEKKYYFLKKRVRFNHIGFNAFVSVFF